MVQSDLELARRVASGERGAFGFLLDRYGARVHRLARRYAGSESDAEDLTQEIFIDLYRGIDRFRGEASLATWTYRIALNHCLRHREKRRREETHTAEADGGAELADPASDPARHLVRRELGAQVHAALDGLSDLHRDVVILHEMHGLTFRECAAVLDIPVGTVKSRLSNAFRQLRDRLGGYVQGEESETLSIVAKGACGETS